MVSIYTYVLFAALAVVVTEIVTVGACLLHHFFLHRILVAVIALCSSGTWIFAWTFSWCLLKALWLIIAFLYLNIQFCLSVCLPLPVCLLCFCLSICLSDSRSLPFCLSVCECVCVLVTVCASITNSLPYYYYISFHADILQCLRLSFPRWFRPCNSLGRHCEVHACKAIEDHQICL